MDLGRDGGTDAFVGRFRRSMRLLLPEGERLVLAVSGGMDSVALLHLVLECPWVDPGKVTVAHFDHALRAESVDEAGFVVGLCRDLGVDVVQKRWLDPQGRGNLQARAREARYCFFAEVAVQSGSRVVATGHHGDDQVETFLEHLLRGSGVRGLAGMSSTRSISPGLRLIRPLLVFFRDEIHQWMRGRDWREDPSNHSEKYKRSQLRHELLPVMVAVAPWAKRQLVETSARMARADGALAWMLGRVWGTLDVQDTGVGLTVSRDALVELPDELVVRFLSKCRLGVTGEVHAPSARAADGFLRRVRSGVGRWEMRIRGMEIVREGDRIGFRATNEAPRKKRKKEIILAGCSLA